MDYWKFMEHGMFGKGSVRKNHKYYQRVARLLGRKLTLQGK